MGVNVVYAPVLDLATNPANPAIGIRAFGDRPEDVARHGIAFLRGLQSAGAAGTVKHFPGIGDLDADTHHRLAGIDQPRSVLDAREFVPFRAAFGADDGAAPRLAMSGHVGLAAVSGRDDLPATLSRAVMTDLLRGDLGFDGLSITDALDMGAITGAAYGAGASAGIPDVVAAVHAGVDLLLASADPVALERIEEALVAARRRATVRRRRDGRHGSSSCRAPGVAGGAGSGARPRGGRVRGACRAGRGARRAVDHPGPRSGGAAAAATVTRRRRPGAGGHAPPGGSDPGRHLVGGRAGPRRRPCVTTIPAVEEIVVEQQPDAAAIAAVHDRATRCRSRRHRHDRRPSPARAARTWSGPSSRPACRRSPSRCAARGTWPATRTA